MSTAVLPSANLAGARVGVWNIEQAIGAGGMGSVWKGKHAETGRLAAIKVILIEQLADERIVKRFEREKRVVVEHDHLVQVLDAGRLPDGRLFLALEYLDGADLEAFCRSQGKLTADHALHFAVQIADGLEALHRAGFIHRDIKPHNVFVTRGRKQHVKLIDYGLAKPLDGSREELLPGMTQEHIGAGTPDYMAPEQFTDFGAVDARADVYSLAMVMFRMLTGRTAYVVSSWQEQMRMRLEQQFEPRQVLEREAPHVPVACYDAIMRGLTYQKEARWPRPRDLVLAFADGIPNGRRRVFEIAPDFEEHAAPTDETVRHGEHSIPHRALVGAAPPAAPPISAGPSSMNGERERLRSSVRSGRARLVAIGLSVAAAAAVVITLIAYNSRKGGGNETSSPSVQGGVPTSDATEASSRAASTVDAAMPTTSKPIDTAAPLVVAAVDAGLPSAVSLRKVRIVTHPSGASITIDGSDAGTAPVVAALPDGAHIAVRAQLGGYQDGEREVTVTPDLGEIDVPLTRKSDAAAAAHDANRSSATKPIHHGTEHAGPTQPPHSPIDLDHPLGPQ
jgi:serine/threonine-protein kinase